MESRSTEKIQHFFKSPLFWDVDINSIDIDTHARFIIARVVSRGNMDDWHTLLRLYGEKLIQQEAVNIRSLDPKSLNFLSVYFNVRKENFRCCN